MSDIPYSVRDKNVRVNAIKGFNFADIETNEMFKKVDDNNVGGTNVFATAGNLTTTGSVNCNDLNISGTLGVGTPSDLGTAGAVLTSNGSGAAVSWTRPYFIKAKLTADYQLTGTTGIGRIINMSAVDFGTGFDYNGTTDWANDEWSCPQTGVYRVSLQLAVQSVVSDQAYYAGAILEVKRGATTFDMYRNELSTSIDEDADQVYLAGTTIYKFEQGDDLRLTIGWAMLSGTVKARGDSVEDQTFLIIERII